MQPRQPARLASDLAGPTLSVLRLRQSVPQRVVGLDRKELSGSAKIADVKLVDKAFAQFGQLQVYVLTIGRDLNRLDSFDATILVRPISRLARRRWRVLALPAPSWVACRVASGNWGFG